MKVVVRADASQEIGTGHVRRMAALAETLVERGAEVRFVWRNLGLDVGQMLPDQCWGLPPLPEPAGPAPAGSHGHAGWGGVEQQQDAAETLGAIADFGADWIVIDHYAFEAGWHDAVREGSGGRILVIDDLADRPLSADLVVDHNYHPDHAAKYASVNLRGAPILAGPNYAMLAAVYAKAPRYRFRPMVHSVGVFMGGVDVADLSGLALEAVASAGLDCPIEIVTTRANPNLDRLEAAVAQRADTRLALDLPNLADFFARHDLQIGAGGGALWERLCIGVPTVAFIAAENQRESVPHLAAIGALAMVDGLGTREAACASAAAELASLAGSPERRMAMTCRAAAMVDGRGCIRIAEALYELWRSDML